MQTARLQNRQLPASLGALFTALRKVAARTTSNNVAPRIPSGPGPPFERTAPTLTPNNCNPANPL